MHHSLSEVIHLHNPFRSIFLVALSTSQRWLEQTPILFYNRTIINQIEILFSATTFASLLINSIGSFFSPPSARPKTTSLPRFLRIHFLVR